MTRRTRATDAAVRHIKAEVPPLKSQLIRYLGDLERVGAAREARGLAAIIGRLEDWQNR
jgi:hypothetical protein